MTSNPADDLPIDPLEADDEADERFDVPAEADPADVAEQHQSAGDADDDDYR
jgi:hypothetical protein